MIKIVITGAESTGKTSLAKDIALHYKAPLREEFARAYLEQKKEGYIRHDISIIAKGQLAQEKVILRDNPKHLICDTDFLVFKIWSEYKYGICDPWINEQLQLSDVDLYILPHHEIPYEPDPLREHPDERHLLFQIYDDTLQQLGLPYIIVEGSHQERLNQAILKIDQLN